MSPYEIMLSESQERMLLVAQKGREEEVFRVFEKWGLDAVEVGRVTADEKCACWTWQVVAEIPNQALTDDARFTSARWSAGNRRCRAKCRRPQAGGNSDFTGI